MLFPEDALFEYVLIALREEIAAARPASIDPLRCDRWVARSALQKLIRRNEPDLAQRALANLYEHDRRSVWRHLAIIAAEDVGVANIDVLAKIIAAYRDRRWREAVGSDWLVMSELVRQMAQGPHCQAACDLLLKVQNDPSLEADKIAALDGMQGDLVEQISDASQPLHLRGIAALAMGGCLTEGQDHADPCGVFDIMSELGHFSHVVATCRASWKLTRNPMLLLLPLVWQAWSRVQDFQAHEYQLPAVDMISDAPGYALDQFTRSGNAVNRAYLALDAELCRLLEAAGIAKSRWVRTLGDVQFLTEGGLTKCRIVWPEAEVLRLPHRWLPAVAALGHNLPAILRHCQDQANQLRKARSEHFHP
jgi:hypothetical protein